MTGVIPFQDRADVDVLADAIHKISTEHGFSAPSLQNLPEKLMLSVSELAEALEAHRSGEPLLWFKHDAKCVHAPANALHDLLPWRSGCSCPNRKPKPEGILTEIGDSVIRNLHMMIALIEESGNQTLSVSDILNIKIDYNAGRPAMHGRAY
jgi:hypothetical protein